MLKMMFSTDLSKGMTCDQALEFLDFKDAQTDQEMKERICQMDLNSLMKEVIKSSDLSTTIDSISSSVRNFCSFSLLWSCKELYACKFSLQLNALMTYNASLAPVNYTLDMEEFLKNSQEMMANMQNFTMSEKDMAKMVSKMAASLNTSEMNKIFTTLGEEFQNMSLADVIK